MEMSSTDKLRIRDKISSKLRISKNDRQVQALHAGVNFLANV